MHRARKFSGFEKKVNTLLELKVLSSKKSFQKNLEWARKGIEQARDYANNETDASFACMYDARKEKQSMHGIKEYAEENKVLLRSYEMRVPADPPVKKSRGKEKV